MHKPPSQGSVDVEVSGLDPDGVTFFVGVLVVEVARFDETLDGLRDHLRVLGGALHRARILSRGLA